MPVFAYKGVDASGKTIRGHVDAESPRGARSRLRRDGIRPLELGETARRAAPAARRAAAARRIELSFLQRIPPLDLAVATRQLATLIGAGVPLVQALSALSEQVENPRLKQVVGRVRDRVNEGSSLGDALAQTNAFSGLYVSMVRAGEAGGALEGVLGRLADYLESQVRLRNKVGSILIYPLLMFAFACIVVGVLVTVVLPQITELLTSLDRELPIYTRVIIGVSDFTRSWWWAMLLSAGAVGLALRAAVRTERGRLGYDRLRLRLPIVGRITRLLAISRFSRTLSTLLAGGLPIVRSLDIARHVTNNVVMGRAIEKAGAAITEGASVAKPLRESGEFPPLVTHMVQVGEQSGELEGMLAKVADTYEEQVETTVTRLTALLEPILIIIMVGIVVTIILATLVPLLEVTSALG